LPNEKYEFSAGWRAAQKGGPAGCTTGWASGLHIKAVCTLSWAAEKGEPEGWPFSAVRPPFSAARRTAFFVQPAGTPFCLVCSSPSKIHLFHLETQPARPAGPPISVIPVFFTKLALCYKLIFLLRTSEMQPLFCSDFYAIIRQLCSLNLPRIYVFEFVFVQ